MRRLGVGLVLVSVFLAALLVPGCSASENVILLELRTDSDVESVEVAVLDGMGRRSGEYGERVGRTRDDINNREPIRLVIQVPNPGPVTVFIRGRAPAGAGGAALLATRCYMLNGVLRDDAMLVRIDDTLDADGDGYPLQTSVTCRDLSETGTAIACDVGLCPDAVAGDCDDGNEDRFPGNDFVCMNAIDENCRNDGLMGTDDEPCADNDMDMWTACTAGAAAGTCDCADDNPARNPSIVEDDMIRCNDGVDDDCSGLDDLCDLDDDGFPSNAMTGGAPDCDDTNAMINPGAPELCDDGVDNNCNRLTDEGAACAPDDLDGDTFMRCPSTGTPDCTTCDCDDCNGAVRPGAPPTCDGLDNITGRPVAGAPPFPDCPGDADGDGAIGTRDCNESNPRIYSGAPENCTTTDVTESCIASGVCMMMDSDGDGYVDVEDCAPGTDMLENRARNPGATEVCDGVDNDCDGILNERDATDPTIGCVFDTTSCLGAAVCEVDFDAPMGDIRHCGGCGLACNPTANVVADQCVGGVCDCANQAGVAACAVTDTCCGTGCFNLQTNHDNCGGCGVVCGVPNSENPTCVAGNCVCEATGTVCGAGTPNCCGTGCVNFLNDDSNCGRCGHTCGPGASCTMGMCTCDSADTDDCDRDMSNPGVLVANGCEGDLTLPTQCGSCGNSCLVRQVATATCSGSPGARACVVGSCNGGFGDCGGGWPDGCETNLNAIATCGATCATRINCDGLPGVRGTTCSGGACGISTCQAGLGDCVGGASDGCETSLFVSTACGSACAGRIDCNALPQVATSTCPGGSCSVSTCDPGFGDCGGGASDGCETNLNAVTTCGSGCGSRVNCNMLPQVLTGTCTGGVCGIMSCDPGFGDCSGGAANGCETNLNSPTTCGAACGSTTDCNALPRVTTGTCPAGSCGIMTCDTGYGNCNASVPDGCEVDLNDPTSCGMSCGSRTDCNGLPNVLAGGCSGGNCSISTCDPGFANCPPGTVGDGCETNTNTDPNNCGGCGVVCGTGETCMGGLCRCGGTTGPGSGDRRACRTGAGASCCSGSCVDLSSPATCGTCASQAACGTYSGGARTDETCVPFSGAYRCRCGGTTAPLGSPACSGSDVCCAGGVNNCIAPASCS